jgi:excisionase family DNA binding protein
MKLKLMSIRELSEQTGISRSKLYELIEGGDMPHYRIGGSIRISDAQIEEYLESCRRGRRPERWPEKTNPVKLKHFRAQS